MKKKTEVEVEEVVETPISPITADFGRADLNQLRDVVNALINRG